MSLSLQYQSFRPEPIFTIRAFPHRSGRCFCLCAYSLRLLVTSCHSGQSNGGNVLVVICLISSTIVELCCESHFDGFVFRDRWTVMQRFAKIATLFMVCASAFAQQKRVELGWTGEKGYFERQTPGINRALRSYISDQRQQEFLRAETDNCADASACRELKVKVSREEVGSPSDKSIFQIVYTFAGAPGTNQISPPYWKSIVIETRPGIYRELLLLRNEGGFWRWPPGTADIENAGTTRLLVNRDQTTSRDMWCTGEFWVLGKSGATLADFSEVVAAIDKAVPSGTQNITPMCDAVDPGKLEVRGLVQKVSAECGACGFEGHVVVKFKFEGQRAVPVSATFKPETE